MKLTRTAPRHYTTTDGRFVITRGPKRSSMWYVEEPAVTSTYALCFNLAEARALVAYRYATDGMTDVQRWQYNTDHPEHTGIAHYVHTRNQAHTAALAERMAAAITNTLDTLEAHTDTLEAIIDKQTTRC